MEAKETIIKLKPEEELNFASQLLLKYWIQRALIPRKSSMREISSVGLKNLFIYATGLDISHNQFKYAMELAGYEPSNPKQEKWYFGISKNSPCLLQMKEKVEPVRKVTQEEVAFALEHHGIAWPYATPLKRGYFLNMSFEDELKLYGYIPVMCYEEWTIFKKLDFLERIKKNPNYNQYLVVDKDNYEGPKKLECIKVDVLDLSKFNYDDCHALYDNDYFGEFDYEVEQEFGSLHKEYWDIRTKQLLDLHGKDPFQATFVGWFKFVE